GPGRASSRRSDAELLPELGPGRDAGDVRMPQLAIPAVVEQPHLDPRLGERPRDEHIVLTERVELELPREPHLVVRRARRVVAAWRNARIEVAVRLQMHGARVLDEALLTQPRLRDDPTALRPGGDEVELVSGVGDAL